MCNTSASFVECRISATGRVFVATSSSNVANAVAGVEGDQSEDTLNRSLIDLSPGESYCARSRFPQWHSSLLSLSHVSLTAVAVAVLLFLFRTQCSRSPSRRAFSSLSRGTRSLLRFAARIRLQRLYPFAGNYWGEGVHCTWWGSGSDDGGDVRAKFSQTDHRSNKRRGKRAASERSLHCAREDNGRRLEHAVAPNANADLEPLSRCHCETVIRCSSHYLVESPSWEPQIPHHPKSLISLVRTTLEYTEITLNLIVRSHIKKFIKFLFLCTAQ